MKIIRLLAVFFLVGLYSHSIQANDSVLLKRRMEKIKALGKELAALPHPVLQQMADSANLLVYYKEMETRYFIPPYTRPEYNIRFALSYLHGVILDGGIDSFKFHYPDPAIDSITEVSKLPGYSKNTLIAYFTMYGADWEMFYFSFKAGSDQLIYLIDAGGDPSWYRRKKHFLDQLYYSGDRKRP